MAHHFPDRKEFKEQFFTLLRPEAGFYKVVLVYSLAISLLTLAVPLSVQLLVDTVANIALPRAVFLIASLLFALLFFSGVMYALRTYAMELFSRKIYSRISSEMAMTAMLAESDYFEEHQQADLFNRYFDIITIKKIAAVYSDQRLYLFIAGDYRLYGRFVLSLLLHAVLPRTDPSHLAYLAYMGLGRDKHVIQPLAV